MSPILVLQLIGAGLSIFLSLQNYQGYKATGDMPTSTDWMTIILPAVLAFLAPYLVKWFPWLEPILPKPKPVPVLSQPSPSIIVVDQEGKIVRATKSLDQIDWAALIPLIMQLLPLILSGKSWKVLYMSGVLQDSDGKNYPVTYGQAPTSQEPSNEPVVIEVPAVSV